MDKKNNGGRIKSIILIVGFYLLISLFFLRGILFSPGIIIGSDWGFPLTPSQMRVFGEQASYVWTNGYNLFGARLPHLNNYLFNFFVSLLSKIEVSGDVFSKILLVFLFTLIGFSSFYFCRKIGLSFKSSLLAGFIYMTTPLVFNYSIMGWIFVLLVMAIIPFFLLAFKLSVEKERVGYSIIAGLLFAIAMFQSQAAFWLPLLMIISFPFLVFSKRRLFLFVRSFLTIFFIVLAVHANWILPLIFAPDPQLTQAVSAYDIQRFEIRLSFVNMLRLWGGLFNYQFETVYPRILLPISFILPILSLLTLILRRKDKKVLYLATIALLPLVIYSLRDILYHLPFSIVIRDFGRMMILSAFPYSFLAAVTFEEVGKIRKKNLGKILSSVIILILFLNTLPFWTGELYGESKIDHDQRLRTFNFPKDYRESEEVLSKDKADTKALYLPAGLFLGFLDNKKFNGPYREVADIFASFSQRPGSFAFSDKTTGSSVDYGNFVLNTIRNNKTMDLRNLLKLTSINSLVVRKNLYGVGGEGPKIEKMFQADNDIIKIFDGQKISIFKNENFLPHFYVPQNLIYSDGDIESLADIVGFGDWKIRSGIYLETETDRNTIEINRNKETLERADEVFVKADLENVVDEKYFKNMETFKNSVPFPYARHELGSFLYPLVLKREQFEEWKIRKDPEKLIDKKLFFAGKRIAEIEKFTDDRDEALVLQIGKKYQLKMEEAIEEVEKLENQESKKDWVIKTRAYLEKHKERLEEIEKLKPLEEIFASLDKKISLLEEKFDLQTLNYNFGISREGNYKLLVKSDELEEIGKMELTIDDEVVATDEVKLRNDGWINFGERNFDQGAHKLLLHLAELKNLVDNNWQESKKIIKEDKGIEFFSQGFYPNAKDLVFQEIEDWQPNNLYYLTFDYQIEGGILGAGVLEEKKVIEDGKEVVKTEKIFNKTLKSGEWKKFETFLRADSQTLGAKIYFYTLTDSDDSGKVEFKNLKIYQIARPKVVLCTSADNTKMNADNTERMRIMPKITFVKINPTKYWIKVEGAKEPYTLIFSESFHQGWKAYVSGQQSAISNQQYGEVVASYFDGDIKEGTHKNIFLDRNTFETWRKKPISEERHLLINGYANSWYITPEDVGGKQNYELIIEFWPQRLFYVGLGISLATLFGCLGYLGYSFAKRKMVIGNEEN